VLAQILGAPRKNLQKDLSSRKGFVWVKRQIDDAEAQALAQANLPGIHLTSEFRRMYPNRHLAGQVLGFVDVDGKGLEGVENLFDERMAGGRAKFVVQRDASGRRLYLDDEGREMNIRGQDVRLTIDTVVQDAAEQALADAVTRFNGRSGMAMVVRVETGDILALAHYPFFNSNIPRQTKPAVRRNRAALDIYEPGSTMKPFLFASALENKVVDPNKVFDCENGKWVLRGKTIRDTHPYRWLSANRVLRYSSNIGTAKIGLALGAQPFYNTLRGLGFGERPGLGLPSESPGILRQAKEWTEFDLAAMSFGQGIGVTTCKWPRPTSAWPTRALRARCAWCSIPRPRNCPSPRRVQRADRGQRAFHDARSRRGGRDRQGGAHSRSQHGRQDRNRTEGGRRWQGVWRRHRGQLCRHRACGEAGVHLHGRRGRAHPGGLWRRGGRPRRARHRPQDTGLLRPPARGQSPQAGGRFRKQHDRARPAPAHCGRRRRHGAEPHGLSVRRALEVLGKRGIVPSLKGGGMEITNRSPHRANPADGGTTAKDGGFILWLGQER
jgi:cell division protein FtsI (penicillin-binding protein 3)